ncbi:hypothetical protein [Streptomyces sp. NPDC001268]|uniref:hypothetical protein n=1 Tax=Streptomyces sp. NPDC001268 TaxID=3364553 RepID=UPI0036BB46C7
MLLDSGGRLVPKHIAETARAVQDSADAVLRVPAIAEALMATAAVADIARGYCPDCGRGDAAPTADQWLEQKQRADEAEAAVARVRHALMNQSYLTSLDETIAAALDPQEQL